jgi:Bacterial Ig-like domain
MQRKPVVRSLLMTAGWLCVAACSSHNDDLFDGMVAPPDDATTEVDPVLMTEPSPVAPPIQVGTPVASNETPDENIPLTVPPPPPPVMQPPSPPVMVEPEGPRIVSVSPEDGARGVSNDVSIVITFNVPMDEEQTEAAYQSERIPSAGVTFSWNDDSTALTITPDQPLAYPAGTDPAAVVSNPIHFFVSVSAQDQDGNHLESPAEFSFALLRQINVQLSAQQDRDLTGTWRSNDTYGQGTCARNQETVCVGDTGVNREQYKGFISFDVSDLPESMASLQSARLNLQITQRPGNPFNALGGLVLDHTEFDAIGPAAFEAAAIAQMGTIATGGNAGTVIQADVRNAVESDVGNRVLSQFRLEFEETTNDNGNADTLISSWNTQRLDVSYLIQ